jgi:CheY-specific phosphatase CheX
MKLTERVQYLACLLPEVCNESILSKHLASFTRLLETDKDILVNGLQTQSLDEQWVTLLLMIKVRVESKGKRFQILNLNKELERTHFSTLWNKTEVFSAGISEAMTSMKENSTPLSPPSFTKAFIQATPYVLYVQTQAISKQGKIGVKKTEVSDLFGDISGIVRLTSGSQFYAVILSFPAPTFLKLISGMLGMTFTEITSDIQDGAAELLSIIHGQARLGPNSEGKGKVSIPFVHVGQKLKTLEFEGHGSVDVASGKILKIPFTSNYGEFAIEVWLPKDFSGNSII